MNKATLNALIGIRDNLNVLIDELEKPTVCSCHSDAGTENVTSVTTTAPAAGGKKTSRKDKEANEKIPAGDEITAESLNAMSYNNLKKLAKSLGVSASGARDEIIERILNAGTTATTEEPVPDDEDEETSEVEETEDDSESEDDDSDDSDDEDDEDDADDEDDSDEEETEEERIVRQVNEAVEDMSNEEIMDVLTDAGIKAKGKRQSLIDAVVKAVMNGDLSLGDDDEDEDDSDSDSDDSADDAEEEFDPNDTSNPAMTKKRKKAIEEFVEDTRHDFKSKSLTRKEIIEWLNEFYGTKDTMKKKSDDELLEEYIHCSCLLIDDDGEMPEEEGAYLVNDVPYCCGRPLKLVDNTYVCEFCGGEYDAEDEE